MLRIDRLVTKCRVPPGREDAYGTLAAAAREQLTQELAGFLGPCLLGRSGYVQIRRLSVRIVVRGRRFDKRRVLEGWVRAICKELFKALAYPEAGGQFEVKRWNSPQHFWACFILDLLSGSAAGKWYYERYAALTERPRGLAVFEILSENPNDLIEQLAACSEEGTLAAALAVLDEPQLEKLMQIVARTGAVSVGTPSLDDLRTVAAAYIAEPLARSVRMHDRRHALQRFVSGWRRGSKLSSRTWLTCTTVLQLISENGGLLQTSELNAEALAGRPLAPDVSAVLQALRASDQLRTEAAEMVEKAGLPKPVLFVEAPWRQIEHASLLLLTAPLLALGCHRQWRSDSMELQCWLYALACQARGEFHPTLPRFDVSAGIFAGIWGEPSLMTMRRVFSAGTAQVGLRDTSKSLLARLKSLLPGFRKAEDSAMVRQFLSTPGRVRLGKNKLTAVLDPNPFWIAAHLAGLDGAVETVPWFPSEDGSAKGLEIRLEGL